MHKTSPADAIALFALFAELDWKPLTAGDHAAFCDAGPDARIAEMSLTRSLTFLRITANEAVEIASDGGLMAIIGGEGPQIEVHGISHDGEPFAWQMPIEPFTH